MSSPIHSIPPEVLGGIVAFFGSSRASWDSDKEFNNMRKLPLLTLAKVCSHWHSVVMHTPSLWSQIEIHARYWSRPCRPALKRALQRSGKHPLSLILDMDCAAEARSQQTGVDDVFALLLELLGEHFTRVERMELTVIARNAHQLLDLRGRLPALHTLWLCISAFHSEPEAGAVAADLFIDTPRLRSVTIESIEPQSIPRLPWAQLRSVVWKDNGTAGFTEYLSRLPPDASFSIHYIAYRWARVYSGLSWHEPDRDAAFPKTTAQLGTLHVDLTVAPNLSHAQQFTAHLFDCLTLSRLHTLSFHRTQPAFPAFWPGPQFVLCARRSGMGRTLLRLDLRHIVLTRDELCAALAELDALEELCIADHPLHNLGSGPMVVIDDELLKLLAAGASGDFAIVHRLKHLSLASMFRFTPEIYLNFVRSRATRSRVPFRNKLAMGNMKAGMERAQAEIMMKNIVQTSGNLRVADLRSPALTSGASGPSAGQFPTSWRAAEQVQFNAHRRVPLSPA